MNNSTDFLYRLEEFVARSQEELERVQQELRENDDLVRQSTSEVERLAQRNSQLRNKVATMESRLEEFSRAEIKSLYQATSEAQIRLFMMRNRVEQLQSKQQTLERHAKTLQGFASLAQFLPAKEELAAMRQQNGAEQRTASSVPPAIGRVIDAQEAERLTLARQMHDGPAQSLTNLILQAELCERLFDRDAEFARQELANLKGLASTTFQTIRDFIFELRPMMLDDLGLAPTLKRYVEAFEEQQGVSVRSHFAGQERRLSPELEITIFRAVQELLNNVVRHANASHVQLTLDLQGSDARVVVEDDGGGFNVNDLLSDKRKKESIGLAALRERVETVGGELAIESSVGRGTRINITLPTSRNTSRLLVG